ncbi:DUF2735 domain-containing protein [Aurantimonas sp. VKM B-3413]|nr:DUF2735 domain-containing protein [Aurantimonas sp. VKM B-3413]MCB8837217.1 DUF2735 domain-containing protein [Aurantimonas sp. VKM B-3413]
MSEQTNRPSAKILQFRPRPDARSRNGSNAPRQASPAPVIIDDCWYHQEAVREAEAARKP